MGRHGDYDSLTFLAIGAFICCLLSALPRLSASTPAGPGPPGEHASCLAMAAKKLWFATDTTSAFGGVLETQELLLADFKGNFCPELHRLVANLAQMARWSRLK